MTMLFRTVRQGSEKARIWEICDEIVSKTGKPPHRQDVVAIYVAEGGNANTGSTQHSMWKKAYTAGQNDQVVDGRDDGEDGIEAPGSVGFRPITIGANGDLSLPKDIRRAMMLDGDGRATVCVVDGELRIMSPLAALHRIQRRTQGLDRGSGLVSDELIAERRAEAAAE